MSEPLSKGQTRLRLAGADPLGIDAGADPLGIDAGADPLGVDRLASARSEPVSDVASRRLRVSLHHHLPRIWSAGFITDDPENGVLEVSDAVN